MYMYYTSYVHVYHGQNVITFANIDVNTCTYQGWDRLQRHDYDYTMITKNDYYYSQRKLITITIMITCSNERVL